MKLFAVAEQTAELAIVARMLTEASVAWSRSLPPPEIPRRSDGSKIAAWRI